jgi:L-2-hydroxyglutarate oxidase
MPDISSTDLVAASTGVRAQAVTDNGLVMDDFVILRGPRSLHVCNAPSPAATAAIPIGEAVVDRVQEQGAIDP